jgi:hypothetical protein
MESETNAEKGRETRSKVAHSGRKKELRYSLVLLAPSERALLAMYLRMFVIQLPSHVNLSTAAYL